MNTISPHHTGDRRRRRLHSDEFKANAVALAAQPGMSMAAVAMSLGINANLLRRWVRDAVLSVHGRFDVVINNAAQTDAPEQFTLHPNGRPLPKKGRDEGLIRPLMTLINGISFA